MLLSQNHDAEQAIPRSRVQVDKVLDRSSHEATGKIWKKRKYSIFDEIDPF